MKDDKEVSDAVRIAYKAARPKDTRFRRAGRKLLRGLCRGLLAVAFLGFIGAGLSACVANGGDSSTAVSGMLLGIGFVSLALAAVSGIAYSFFRE